MKYTNGRVYFPLFNPCIVGPVNVRPVGHILLRHLLRLTDINDSQTESSVKEVTVHNEKNIQYPPFTCLVLIHNKSIILACCERIIFAIVLLPS